MIGVLGGLSLIVGLFSLIDTSTSTSFSVTYLYIAIPRGNADNKKEQIKFLLPVPQISITNKLNNFSKKIEGARNGQLFELPL